MQSRKKLSQKQFEKRHPDMEVRGFGTGMRPGRIFASIVRKGKPETYVAGIGTSQEEALWDASKRCYELAGHEVMNAQAWKDPVTGQTGVALERHHKKPRSKGRDDSKENLVGVTRETHNQIHEGKSLPGKAAPHR